MPLDTYLFLLLIGDFDVDETDFFPLDLSFSLSLSFTHRAVSSSPSFSASFALSSSSPSRLFPSTRSLQLRMVCPFPLRRVTSKAGASKAGGEGGVRESQVAYRCILGTVSHALA